MRACEVIVVHVAPHGAAQMCFVDDEQFAQTVMRTTHPLPAHQLPMPAQDSLRLDDADAHAQLSQRAAARRAQAQQDDHQRQLLDARQAWRLSEAALHYRKLLAQDEDFEVFLGRRHAPDLHEVDDSRSHVEKQGPNHDGLTFGRLHIWNRKAKQSGAA